MSTQELWHWVHSCYGDELGLTSDDDDYIAPATNDISNPQLQDDEKSFALKCDRNSDSSYSEANNNSSVSLFCFSNMIHYNMMICFNI